MTTQNGICYTRQMPNPEKTVTNNDLAELIIRLDQKFNTLEKNVNLKIETEIESLARMTQNQFEKQDEKMDRKFESIDRRFENIDRKFQAIDQRFDTLTTIITEDRKDSNQKFRRLGVV